MVISCPLGSMDHSYYLIHDWEELIHKGFVQKMKIEASQNIDIRNYILQSWLTLVLPGGRFMAILVVLGGSLLAMWKH